MSNDKLYCARHNRRYSVGYDCPDCERDDLLSSQADAISEISSRLDSGLDVDLKGMHEHTVSGKVDHEHDGLVIHVGIPLGGKLSKDEDQMLQHQFVAGVALSELRNDCLTFDGWVNLQKGNKGKIAIAMQNAITENLILEDEGDDGAIVLKVNSEHPFLKKLLPAKRNRNQFLRDLYFRIATGYDMPHPDEADKYLMSSSKSLE